MKKLKTSINGKPSSVYGLEDITLLKCPYYNSNLQIQWNPYQNSNSITYIYICLHI
jgi:hypothetical protein